MARTEFEPQVEQRLKFGQRFVVRLDKFITSLTDTRRQVAEIPNSDPFETHDPSTPVRVELHRRFDRSGAVRKAITHIVSARGQVVGREVFESEADLKRTWSQLQFRPL